MHTEHVVDEHMQAAEKLDRAEGSAQEALDQTDDNRLPSDSEMQEAVERARDANSKEKCRRAEQESHWRSLML